MELLPRTERWIEDEQIALAVLATLESDDCHGVTWLLEKDRWKVSLVHFRVKLTVL